MTLKQWLAAQKMSDAEFARISGIGQRALIQKYRNGTLIPRADKLRLIRDATRGAVTADDFVDQRNGVSSNLPLLPPANVTTAPKARTKRPAPPPEPPAELPNPEADAPATRRRRKAA